MRQMDRDADIVRFIHLAERLRGGCRPGVSNRHPGERLDPAPYGY